MAVCHAELRHPAGVTGHPLPLVLQGLGIDRVTQRSLGQCRLTHRADLPGNTTLQICFCADLGTDLVHRCLGTAQGNRRFTQTPQPKREHDCREQGGEHRAG